MNDTGVSMTNFNQSLSWQTTRSITSYFTSPGNDSTAAPSRWQICILIIILATATFLSLRNYNQFQVGAYQDDASYAVLARSIVFSETYGLSNVPGSPLPTRYPFGYPLLISPAAWLFPEDLGLLRVVSLLATLINIALIFWGWQFLNQNRSFWWSLGISALYALSPLVIGHTRMVMSEPVFTTFVLIALMMTEKYVANEESHTAAVFLTGAVIFFTLFIRTIGVAVLVASVFRIFLLQANRSVKIHKVAYMSLGGLALLAIIVFATPITVESLLPVEYINQFQNPKAWGAEVQIDGGLSAKAVDGFTAYISRHLREAIFPVGGGDSEIEFGRRLGIPDLPLLTSLLMGCLILLGTFSIMQGRGFYPSVLVYEVLYFGIALIWPWRGDRLLYPILPFLLDHFLRGIQILLQLTQRMKWIPGNIGRPIPLIGSLSVITVMISLFFVKGITDNSSSFDHVRDLRVGATWLKENSQEDVLVMAQQPQGVYLYSNRHTVDFPSGTEFDTSEQFEKFALLHGVDYILIGPEMIWRNDGKLEYDSFTTNEILPVVADLVQKNALEIVFESKQDLVTVYRITHP